MHPGRLKEEWNTKGKHDLLWCSAAKTPLYLGAVGSHGDGPHDSNTSQWRNDN